MLERTRKLNPYLAEVTSTRYIILQSGRFVAGCTEHRISYDPNLAEDDSGYANLFFGMEVIPCCERFVIMPPEGNDAATG